MGVPRVVFRVLMPVALVVAGCQNQEEGAVRSGAGMSSAKFESVNMDCRKRRVDRLTEPYGWLSLAGLEMLQPDSVTTVGSNSANDVVVSAGPSRWGSVRVDEAGRARFDVAATGEVRIDGGPMFKRIRPRARGMAFMIKKRSSHIRVGLTHIDEF